MKWLLLLVLAMVAVRLLIGRWPWEPGRAGRRSIAKAKARNLLGVGEGASRADIIEAHKRLVARVHPDRGGTNEQVHEANSARDLLLGELARRNMERT